MPNRANDILARMGSGLAMVAAVLWHGGALAAPITACVDQASPAAGMDRSLAQAVGQQARREIRVQTFDGSGDEESGFGLDNFATLLAGGCDLVLGFPIDASTDHDALPASIHKTEPYARTGFVLVLPKAHGASTLDTMPDGTSVAVTYQTMPNLYFAQHPNLRADVRANDAESVSALEDGSVAAAMLWRPTVAHYLAAHDDADNFVYFELDDPHARWNLVALYTADEVGRGFNSAIRGLRESGALAAVLEPYATVLASPRAAQADLNLATPRQDKGRLIKTGMASESGARTEVAAGGMVAAASAPTPALYTNAQARAGEEKFAENCSYCHGNNMEGRAGPALKGRLFAPASGQYHLGDIFTVVSQNMPATQPASLPAGDYVEIMAFILENNGYPAGDTALTFDGARNSTMPLIYRGP